MPRRPRNKSFAWREKERLRQRERRARRRERESAVTPRRAAAREHAARQRAILRGVADAQACLSELTWCSPVLGYSAVTAPSTSSDATLIAKPPSRQEGAREPTPVPSPSPKKPRVKSVVVVVPPRLPLRAPASRVPKHRILPPKEDAPSTPDWLRTLYEQKLRPSLQSGLVDPGKENRVSERSYTPEIPPERVEDDDILQIDTSDIDEPPPDNVGFPDLRQLLEENRARKVLSPSPLNLPRGARRALRL